MLLCKTRKQIYFVSTGCYQGEYPGKNSEQLATMMVIDNDMAGTLFITSLELHREKVQ